MCLSVELFQNFLINEVTVQSDIQVLSICCHFSCKRIWTLHCFFRARLLSLCILIRKNENARHTAVVLLPDVKALLLHLVIKSRSLSVSIGSVCPDVHFMERNSALYLFPLQPQNRDPFTLLSLARGSCLCIASKWRFQQIPVQ